MYIGNVKLENNIFLAPMAGITDLPFRVLCKKYGCGLVYSEMVSAKGLYYKDKKTKLLLDTVKEEKPIAGQIFGSDPKIMAFAAEKIVEAGFNIVDINMGCPTPKIVKNGEGSALMLKPDLVGKIVKEVVNAVKVPVTIKIRKGWDDNNCNAVEVAKIIEDNGAQALAVHGRTREQFYRGKADWGVIKNVKESISIPVIGNGDIFSCKEAEDILNMTGCDAIMIGRGSKGNPWIFKNVINYIKYGIIEKEVQPRERILKALEHTKFIVEYKGEGIGIKEARKHIAWYIRGLKNSSKIKNDVNKMVKYKDIEDLLLKYACEQ
jgi:nifR3 family TIM-barrel protein